MVVLSLETIVVLLSTTEVWSSFSTPSCSTILHCLGFDRTSICKDVFGIMILKFLTIKKTFFISISFASYFCFFKKKGGGGAFKNNHNDISFISFKFWCDGGRRWPLAIHWKKNLVIWDFKSPLHHPPPLSNKAQKRWHLCFKD